MSGRGMQEPVSRAVPSVPCKAAGKRGGERGLPPAASDAGPRPRGGGDVVSGRRAAVVLAVLGVCHW